jgi:hypothetical protein
VSLPTPRTSRAAHVTVTVYCRHCQHSAPLDLAGMAESGHGDTPLLELPLRCDHCGAIAYRISVSGPHFSSPRPPPRAGLAAPRTLVLNSRAMEPEEGR